MADTGIVPPRFGVVSLFSGAMGFDVGLEATGRFETLAAIEFDKACCETIRLNRDEGRTARRDMRVYGLPLISTLRLTANDT